MSNMNMNDPIVKRIVKARVKMLMNPAMAFFGTLAIRLIPKQIDKQFCPTMGTDGKYLYYCREFVDMIDDEELKYMLGHSVLHCCYDHMGRRGRRDKEIYAKATDYIVNKELADHKVGKMVNRPDADPPMIPCYEPSKYADMTSDELYETLLNEQQQDNGNGNQQGGGKGKQGGKGGGGSGGGDQQGGGGHSYDTHFDPDDVHDEESGIANMTEEERAMLSDEIRQATMQAAKSAGAGRTPLGIMRMLQDLLEPKMDWREHLTVVTQSLMTSDYTYTKPNRRNSSLGGIILPGHENDERVSVCCAIDTSGSISDSMIRDFLSEVKGIMDQFKDFELKIWCFDTETYTVWNYNPDNIDELEEFYPEGGGGTDFMANWRLMQKLDIIPAQFVMFTDGEPFGEWGIEDYQENLIYLIHGNPNREAPFGITLHYED